MKPLGYFTGMSLATILLSACGGGAASSVGANTIPQVHKNVQTENVLYSFGGGTDGAFPSSGLINVGGTLYGTTGSGGTSGNGTVFQITTAGVYNQLYSFAGGAADGAVPSGGLVDVNGTLYGTTEAGGATGNGTVFKITTSGTESVVYNFAGGTDGSRPQYAALVNLGGKLYGTTVLGGQYNAGTVFKVTTSGTETVLHSFGSGSDGVYPYAGLVNLHGTLYGTTDIGGTYGQGVVFAITKAGVETVIHNLGSGTDGAQPISGLISVNGALDGMTAYGGTSGDGVIYTVTTSGVETVLYSFKAGPDGKNPGSNLTNVGGTLFGTTDGGGGSGCTNGNGCGTIFAWLPNSGLEIVVYTFGTGTDGNQPTDGAGLINVGGTLYGTTHFGGTNGQGTVFSLSF